jgi:cysteine-rich repeat protein
MAYDFKRDKVLLFGGYNGLWFKDIWEWSSETGEWIERTPEEGSPSERSEHGIVYNPGRDKITLFGGRNNNDTWEWNNSNGVWIESTPTGANPPAQYSRNFVFDFERGKMLLFGKQFETNYQEDPWELDGGELYSSAQIIKILFSAIDSSPQGFITNEITFNIVAGGTGYTGTNCSALNGSKMVLWNTDYRGGAWIQVAQNNNAAVSPGEISFTTTDPDLISHLFFGDERSINVAVAPTSANGCGNAMGSIAVDYAEVTVRYSIDPDAEQPDPMIDDLYYISDEVLTWDEARAVCQSMNGDLVSINSELEQYYIEQMMDPALSYWIGATDRISEGDWRWVDGTKFWQGDFNGTPYGYSNWNSDEPNNYDGDEDYAGIYGNTYYRWNDFSGTVVNNYICEFDEDSLQCGDGTQQDWEQCEDGNTVTTDACVFCKNAICGDGFVWAGNEECDDANENENDLCLNNCTKNLNYCTPTVSLATWASGDNGWSYTANWARQTTAGQGGANGWMRFYYSPAISTSYTRALTSSTTVNISGCTNPTISFYSLLDNYNPSGNEYLRLDCSGDGGGTWAENIWTINNTADHSWTQRIVTIPAGCCTDNAVFRFRATGVNTNNIDWWGVDTVTVN